MRQAIISDIHGNLEALTAVLDDIGKRRIKKVRCLGDIVGYGANPNECINLLKKNKIESVAGNHDYYAVTLKDLHLFNERARDVIVWANKQLTNKNKIYLSNLPETIKTKKIFIVHGSPYNHLWGYIYRESLDSVDFPAGVNTLFTGHTHRPYVVRKDGRLAINPGSVGQPRDGDRRASYCIFDGNFADIIRVEYDIETAAGKISKAGLPEGLADRLFIGR